MSWVYSVSGSPVQPSEVAYRAFTISANTTLYWAFANQDTDDVTALFMKVTASASSLSLMMPPANQASTGYSVMITNGGSTLFTILDGSGNTITTLSAGETKYLTVTDNSSIAGTWLVTNLGIGTISVSTSSLAGQGLKAIASSLNVNSPVTTTSTTPYASSASDRGNTINWTGGVGTITLTAAATLGAGWYTFIRNSGSGTLTVDPDSSETINDASTLAMAISDSCLVVCDGTNFYTIGLGQSANFSFTRLAKSVAGSSDVTLTSAEQANKIMEFTGTLTGNINVIFSAVSDNFWIKNSTSGSFTLTCKTAAGTGVAITQSEAHLITCDGTNIYRSEDSGSGTVTSVAAGTGLGGGTITTSGTISIANTGVSASTYNLATVTVNAQGQITSASDGLATVNNFTKQQYFGTATLTDAASISWNLNDAQVAKVTLAGNRTLSNPTNMVDGGTYILRVIQDATGSRTLAYDTAYKWSGGAPTLTTTANAIDIITFTSDGTYMYGIINKNFT